MQRPDSTHLAWVSMVSWPLMVAVIAQLVHQRRSQRRTLSTPEHHRCRRDRGADARREALLHVSLLPAAHPRARSAICRCRSWSSEATASSGSAIPRSRTPLIAMIPGARRAQRARRLADRRHRRSEPHGLQRRVDLLPVPRTRPGAPTTSRWTPVSPTPRGPASPRTSNRPTSWC